MVQNLKDLMAKFSNEDVCREYLAKQRWNGEPVCPYCGAGKHYIIENGKRYKCGNSECYKKYSVTVGSIFHASNIPLTTWFPAMYLILSHKKGISSIQLAKDLGVTQKTAWFMLHRIREALKEKGSSLLGGTVEIDEVYMGGKVGNMSKSKRKKLRDEGNTFNTKTMVMGMLERDGNLRLAVTTANVPALQKTVRANVAPSANVITDSHAGYFNLKQEHTSHEVIRHSAFEYVRAGNIHTNSIEGAFSQLKRSIYGIYHQVSPKHLNSYCNETAYRYNSRKIKDGDRFTLTLSKVDGKLPYRVLVSKPKPKQTNSLIGSHIKGNRMSSIAVGALKPVYQLFDGEIVAQYESLTQASEMTGIAKQSISKALNGWVATTKGYQWKFVNLAEDGKSN